MADTSEQAAPVRVTPLQATRLAQRATVFCPSCQELFLSPASAGSPRCRGWSGRSHPGSTSSRSEDQDRQPPLSAQRPARQFVRDAVGEHAPLDGGRQGFVHTAQRREIRRGQPAETLGPARRRWAALTRRVWQVDPLRCGAPMNAGAVKCVVGSDMNLQGLLVASVVLGLAACDGATTDEVAASVAKGEHADIVQRRMPRRVSD